MIAEDMNRREFLKKGVGLAVAAAGLEMITGCATTETPKDQISQAKEKVDHKFILPKRDVL